MGRWGEGEFRTEEEEGEEGEATAQGTRLGARSTSVRSALLSGGHGQGTVDRGGGAACPSPVGHGAGHDPAQASPGTGRHPHAWWPRQRTGPDEG